MKRMLRATGVVRSHGGRSLERAFLIRFRPGVDAQIIARQLSRLPHFQRVGLNRLYIKEYCGVRRDEPPSSTEFDSLWNFDHPTNDKVDIDMPEAWAIEKGDPNVIIVINDAGTLVDTCGSTSECDEATNWVIHPDFNHYWIAEEDSASPGVLNRFDIQNTDSDGDGVADNIIGANFAPGFEADTLANGDPNYQLAFWRAMPTSLRLREADPEESSSWQCVGYESHGLRVASIAAARVEGTDAVGIAYGCKVYWVRGGGLAAAAPTAVWDEAAGIVHSAEYGAVINMSWIFLTDDPPDSLMTCAVDYAANDRDCVLVAAVGNNGFSNKIGWPARYEEVLAVGAVQRVGSLDSLIHAPYSNFISNENAVDVVAPVDPSPGGVWVDDYTYDACSEGSCPCRTSRITGWSREGTSFASPQAAGIAALIRSRFPALDQAQVRARVKRGAEYYWAPGDSPRYGAGKVNAYRSLTEWGTITENTTWGAVSGMPDTMYVSGDLTIASGVTLTLNHGTVVRIAGGDILEAGNDPGRVEIVVQGQLAVGSGGSGSIVFESFTDGTPSDDDWVGIRFDTTQTAPLEDLIVRNAQIGIEVASGSLALEPVTVQDCQTGIEISGGWASIRSSTFEGNTFYGVRAPSASTGVTVAQSTIRSNDVGIYLATSASAAIDSCTIDLNDVGVEIYDDSLVTIRDCAVTDNTTDGVYAHTNAHILVEGSTIDGNAAGVMAYASRPRIKSGNVITGNATGIKCDTNAHAVVESTTVTSGTIGILAFNGSNPDVGHATGSLSVGDNIIHSHSSHYIVNLTIGVTVMAENNWWNNSAGPKASKFSGSVDYTPWLTGAPSLVAEARRVEDETETPGRGLTLSHNYPNPFNPDTQIGLEVPRAGSVVRLAIYDVAGRRVRTLAAGRLDGGTHRFHWDGRDDGGQAVASGVYFLRLSAPSHNETRKLVLLR